jgi:amino acid transporter
MRYWFYRWRRTISILSIIFIVLIAIVASAIFFIGAFQAKVSSFGYIALLLMFFASLAVFLLSNKFPPRNEGWIVYLTKREVITPVLAAIISSSNVLFTIIPLLERKIESEQNETTQIEQKLSGVWGQEDCANTYDFKLDEREKTPRLLNIASLDNGDGVNPAIWSFVVEAAMPIIGSDGYKRSKLRTTEEIGLLPKYKGSKVEFTLALGAVETLRWESFHTDENGIRDVNPLTLKRCLSTESK